MRRGQIASASRRAASNQSGSQRFIELDFTIDAANNRVEVTAPLNGNVAPPGEWMLFLISDTGVPSVGKFIRLTLP